jgi:hypothetical protein
MTRLLRAIALASLLVPAAARADGLRVSEAEALFEQGRALAAEGKWAEACPKFAASQEADPGAGTLLNLANCYEQNGQNASSWATFKEAASMAKQQGRADWEELARTRAAALEPKLSKIVIVVGKDASAPGLLIKRDGAPVAEGAWNAPLPLDPQPHVIEASAPGKLPWSTTATLAADGATTTIIVPRLADAPTPPPDQRAPATDTGRTQRRIGLAVAAVGAAGLMVGTITGILAINKEADSRNLCSNETCSSPDAFQANDDARSLARASTIAFIVGGAAAVAGGVLWLTAPRARASAAGVGVAPTFGGLHVVGAW